MSKLEEAQKDILKIGIIFALIPIIGYAGSIISYSWYAGPGPDSIQYILYSLCQIFILANFLTIPAVILLTIAYLVIAIVRLFIKGENK